MTESAFTYVGSELAIFAQASNWKLYFARQLRPFVGARVLEVGAGAGGSTVVLCSGESAHWTCLEPDRELSRAIMERVERGSLPACCESRVGTLADLDAGERFDTIFYIDVLEHIERDHEELAHAARHLDRGGHLVVLAPAHEWLFSPFDRAVGHYRRYTRPSLVALQPPDLRLVRACYLDSVGLLASLANRLFLRRSMPGPAQIRFWDSFMVPCSRVLDPLIRFGIGKTVVVAWTRI